MISEIGPFLLGFALFAIIYAVCAMWYGIRNKNPNWQKSGQRAILSTNILLFSALAILILGFAKDQFQINYIAQHSSKEMPFYLKISAVWAGQEGSLLLWSFLQATFAAIESKRGIKGDLRLSKWASIFLGIISAFFIAMTLIFSNPFIASNPAPINGQGMNPLLRHPGMVFHPPILYLGYVGLAVPFAYALASLITQKVNIWTKQVHHWILFSWLALGVGIILGSRWAYDVLGWGGYWGWDAVENAGLMPWLISTALLHSVTQQKRGNGFRIWDISLAALSFILVLFGTFTTRSGFIQSVHAFSRSQMGYFFLIMIGLTIIGTSTLMFARRKSLSPNSLPEKVFSREGTTLLTLILLVLTTLSILIGTLLPTLTNGRFTASTSWFNRVVGPQLGVLVLLMGICPLFGRFGRSFKRSKWLILFPIFGLIGLPGFLYFLGFTAPVSLIGYGFAGFSGGAVLGELVGDLSYAKSDGGKKPFLLQLNLKSRVYSSLLIHFGIVLIAVGVIGTQFYALEEMVTLSPGDFTEVGNYSLLNEDLFQETERDQVNTWAVISIYEGSNYLTTIEPQISYYPGYDQVMAQPAILSRLDEDLYLVFFNWDETGAASFKVMINPLSSFLWMGGLLLILGGMWSWTRLLSLKNRKASRIQIWMRRVGMLIGFTMIVVLAVTLWGNPFEGLGKAGRPLPGQQAPNFKAQNLNGDEISVEDYRGKTIVLNFWASWCPQCEEELLMIEKVRLENEYDNVVFVAVAMNDTQDTISSIASELNLNYLLIADSQGDISRSYGVTAVPETFIISPDGVISGFHIGVLDESTLIGMIESIQ